MAFQLYGEQMARPDEAFPTLIKSLIPAGMRGFIFAAIAGAVVSSLASMLNSASTIFTIDIYNRMINREASQKRLVFLGRVMTLIFMMVGCTIAPALDNPKFGGVFQFIQQFQGYIWPGVVAAFLFGFVVKRAPGSAGVVALVGGPIIYHILQRCAEKIHFLIQVGITFVILCIVMGIITVVAPLKEPKVLPVREDMDIKMSPEVKWAGGLVIAGVILFFILFW
jgi:SSS family solute:Na+ symporter